MSDLVGRARELDIFEQLLLKDGVRLLTLTGPGGIGKTRLAVCASARVASRFDDGVTFVDLAPLSDAPLVIPTIANTLGVPNAPDRSVLDALIAWLQRRRMLLILDNFERVIDAASDVAALIAACPQLSIVVTSRARLRVDTERELPIDPLGTHPALELFVQRARAARADFQATAANRHALVEICTRLDGIPLAIELAAARVKVLSAEQIAERLDDRFRLLTNGASDAPTRHRTLRAALDWSFELLEEAERVLLRRMAVFPGGATIDALERVCADDILHDSGILDHVSELLDQSLVFAIEHAGAVRYRMLDTVRQYAAERLDSAGEAADMSERHASFCLNLAEQAEPELLGPMQLRWLQRLDQELPNLRAAMSHFLGRVEADHGLRLSAALWKFCEVRGHAREGEDWLDAALSLDATHVCDASIRSKALHGAANLAFVRGDYGRSALLHDENLELRRRIGDTRGVGISLFHRASVARSCGDTDRAIELCHESLALFRALGDRQWCANVLNSLGTALGDRGAFAAARAALEESLTLFRGLGGTRRIAIALGNLGDLARAESDYDRAEKQLLQSLELFHQLEDAWGTSATLNSLAHVAHAVGNWERAALLFGAAEAQREEAGAALEPAERPEYDRAVDTLKVRLGSETVAAAWSRGRALSRPMALEYAQRLLPPDRVAAPTSVVQCALTEREREVAALIARGLTNRQIADALVITKQTADKHVGNILSKLGAASRAQVAVWWVSHYGQTVATAA